MSPKTPSELLAPQLSPWRHRRHARRRCRLGAAASNSGLPTRFLVSNPELSPPRRSLGPSRFAGQSSLSARLVAGLSCGVASGSRPLLARWTLAALYGPAARLNGELAALGAALLRNRSWGTGVLRGLR